MALFVPFWEKFRFKKLKVTVIFTENLNLIKNFLNHILYIKTFVIRY